MKITYGDTNKMMLKDLSPGDVFSYRGNTYIRGLVKCGISGIETTRASNGRHGSLPGSVEVTHYPHANLIMGEKG